MTYDFTMVSLLVAVFQGIACHPRLGYFFFGSHHFGCFFGFQKAGTIIYGSSLGSVRTGIVAWIGTLLSQSKSPPARYSEIDLLRKV